MSCALDPPISSTRHSLIFDHSVGIKSGNMPQRGTKITKMPSLVFLCLFVAVYVIETGPQALVKTVSHGVFSEAQTKRADVAYAPHCSVCHGKYLERISAPSL